MDINKRLMEARKALNMPQKDFAKALYISSGFLSDIEKNRRRVNDRFIKLVSMVFGINENWLKNGEGEMFHKSPDEKVKRLVNIFNELPPDFQDFALLHLDRLLDLRNKQKT